MDTCPNFGDQRWIMGWIIAWSDQQKRELNWLDQSEDGIRPTGKGYLANKWQRWDDLSEWFELSLIYPMSYHLDPFRWCKKIHIETRHLWSFMDPLPWKPLVFHIYVIFPQVCFSCQWICNINIWSAAKKNVLQKWQICPSKWDIEGATWDGVASKCRIPQNCHFNGTTMLY